MVKSTTASHSWNISDIKRADVVDADGNGVNPIDHTLLPNTNATEYTSANDVDFLSNGFKWRMDYSNNDPGTFFYMAFGESFKYANAR